MVTIARYQLVEQAHLLRLFLESQGFHATVFDEHLVQMDWLYANAIGGVRVVVPEEEADDALDAGREFWVIQHDPANTRTARLWPLSLFASWALGVPVLLFRRKAVGETTGRQGTR